jgi:hypothetical protein
MFVAFDQFTEFILVITIFGGTMYNLERPGLALLLVGRMPRSRPATPRGL